MKRSVCFVLISILVLCSLGAGESITVSWKETGDNSSIYRWKTANSDWIVTNEEEISYTVERNKGEVFQIQSSFDGEVWSSSHLVAVVPEKGSSAIFSWDNSDTSFLYYRWRRGNEEWNVTQIPGAQSSYRYGEVEIYHIQASYDGENWSADHAVVITSEDEIEAVFSWENNDDEISFFRWRVDGGEWNTVDSSSHQIRITLASNGRHIFEVCGSYDGMNWSEPALVLLTAVRVSPPMMTKTNPIHLEAAASLSLSSAIYDFYNGHNITGARYLMGSRAGWSGSIEAGILFADRFRLYGSFSYSRERKKETVIPNAFLVEHRQIGGGFDVLFPIGEKWRPYVGLSMAKSMDINAGYYSYSLFLGGRIGLDYFISEHFYVGIKSGVRIAHNDAEDPLYRSYTYLLDPIGIKMGVKF